MILHFLRLQKKNFFRSAYWQKNLFLNILLGLFALFLLLIFGFLGVAAYMVINKELSEIDPLEFINSYLLYAFFADLMFRYVMQKMPIMQVKPLLVLPIKKSKMIHFLLMKSSFSFFNIIGMIFYLPFAITLIANDYSILGVFGWLFSLKCVVLSLNYLNFLVNKNNKALVIVGGILFVLVGLHRFTNINIAGYGGQLFDFVYANPLASLPFLAVLGVLYVMNFKFLRGQLYLDTGVADKVDIANTSDLSWADKFGDIAPFIKNDIRLILRNKRTKSSVWVLLIGLLYGLFIYPNPVYQGMDSMFVFVGIFSTGIFLINFGQFIPAWDAGYYNMLMSQNFKYGRYLESKFILMAISVVLLFVLGIPYVFFGWKILAAHFAAMIYNLGVNSHIMLYGGSFNRKKINLNKKAAFNFQGTGAVQWLIGLPLMLVPMLIFGLINWLVNFEIAVGFVAFLGLIGVVLHRKIMTAITNKYKTSKYIMINAFGKEA